AIGDLQELVERARQDFLERRREAGIGTERGALGRGGADDDDLVAECAQSRDDLLDMDGLAVLRADAMVVEDFHPVPRPVRSTITRRCGVSGWPRRARRCARPRAAARGAPAGRCRGSAALCLATPPASAGGSFPA